MRATTAQKDDEKAMARKIGQDWEKAIPIRVADIYVSGVEHLLSDLPPVTRATKSYRIAESRTRFLRELIDELMETGPRPPPSPGPSS